MGKTVIVILVTIAGLATVGFALLANKPKQPELVQETSSSTQTPATAPSEPATQETATVTYDESGFSPATITIAKGTTVTFVNNSDMPLWVASNPHPAHTDYPEFDTPKILGRMPKMEEDFTFTFDRAGTWQYHNHTASGDTGTYGVHPGTIIVE